MRGNIERFLCSVCRSTDNLQQDKFNSHKKSLVELEQNPDTCIVVYNTQKVARQHVVRQLRRQLPSSLH